MLEVRDLRKRYGDVVALDGCSFKARRGRVLGFLGRNGAGKTTAMRGIFGLIALDGGSVRWEGRAVGREDVLSFGYMPEERGLYPKMKVREQLVFFGRLRGLESSAAGEQADYWLRSLGLEDRAEARLEQLSHGNQQRVQLAVSLVGSPTLLVLDEPFSGLDPIAVETLSRVIREQAGNGAAVVFSSHQLDLVGDICDDIAIIIRGRTALEGDLGEVRRTSPDRYVDIALEAGLPRSGLDEAIAQLGAGVVNRNGSEIRLKVPAGLSPSKVLGAFEGRGRVEYFKLEPPTLEDIFREASQ